VTDGDVGDVRQVDGSLYVVYNMGLSSQPIGELEYKVNDGKYHVLRFTRRGQNASVQLDDKPPLFKHPPGQFLPGHASSYSVHTAYIYHTFTPADVESSPAEAVLYN